MNTGANVLADMVSRAGSARGARLRPARRLDLPPTITLTVWTTFWDPVCLIDFFLRGIISKYTLLLDNYAD